MILKGDLVDDLVLGTYEAFWLNYKIYEQNGTFIQFKQILLICSTCIIFSKHAIDVYNFFSGIYHDIEQYWFFLQN